MRLDLKEFEKKVRGDFEFGRETRYLTGIIKIAFPEQSVGLRFSDGKLLEVTEGAPEDDHCTIVIRGDNAQWQALLEDKPKPFFQCLQSANIKHGFGLSSKHETFAYLPALNRMTTLMRQVQNGGSSNG